MRESFFLIVLKKQVLPSEFTMSLFTVHSANSKFYTYGTYTYGKVRASI